MERPSLGAVARVFLLLGVIGFGGPAAHVALMRRQIVERRGWLDETRFLRMFAACNLIPGPSSTELGIYLGYSQRGIPGMLVAGTLFILPALLLMLAIAWIYTLFDTSVVLQAVLYGVRPVIVAVVLWALIDLARKVTRRPLLIVLAVAVFAGAVVGINPVPLLFGAGLVAAGLTVRLRAVPGFLPLLPLRALPAVEMGSWFYPAAHTLPLLFLTFLKIGAVAYGSGYVLLAFLHTDLVHTLHWVTDRQVLDAVAIGTATPGPVFTTATFLGYLSGGVPGALLATLGIFLPGFVLVLLLNPLVNFVHERPWAAAGLEGINAAVIGLIGAVSVSLMRVALVDGATVLLTGVSLVILIRRPMLSPLLMVVAAGIGVVLKGGLGG